MVDGVSNSPSRPSIYWVLAGYPSLDKAPTKILSEPLGEPVIDSQGNAAVRILINQEKEPSIFAELSKGR